MSKKFVWAQNTLIYQIFKFQKVLYFLYNQENVFKWQRTPGFWKYLKNTSVVTAYREGLGITSGWTRKHTVMYTRLLASNCTDLPFLFKIKKCESDTCTCGYEKATLKHALWIGEQHSVARYAVLDSLETKGWNTTQQ